MKKLTQSSTKLVMKHWKAGFIRRYDFNEGTRLELKRFGIIEYSDKKGYYIINTEVYLELLKGEQTTLL